ncbi:hypothetical protein KTR66_19370 [Roseococcus sp. SDR]|uniref:hypothetical protein n=1 Tax=Roseococcus sp. SDR TaxID=2835532 RepID=UPI001BCF9468|nr:hypothetical protein [Roseococcus sp. SDR]MBS7792168.1 hypothetical protein [Roseococcus sp. SDR]MBV1847482.1 hypothetical protein [Roseococcus sp. SDR]
MLKLNLKPEPRWLEIGGGVRVKVPPLDTAILRAVEYEAWRAYSALKLAVNEGDETRQLSDLEVARLEGAFALAKVRALAGQIMAWEGVTDEEGQALHITPEALDAFAAHPIAGPAFRTAYDGTVAPLLAEGNGSEISSPGDGAAAIDTAPAAAPAPAADAAPAPSSETLLNP